MANGIDLSGKISAICGANLSAGGKGGTPGGRAVVSRVDGVSTDITGSPGVTGGDIRTGLTGAGGANTGAGLPRVAVVQPLTYSVTNNRNQKE